MAVIRKLQLEIQIRDEWEEKMDVGQTWASETESNPKRTKRTPVKIFFGLLDLAAAPRSRSISSQTTEAHDAANTVKT